MQEYLIQYKVYIKYSIHLKAKYFEVIIHLRMPSRLASMSHNLLSNNNKYTSSWKTPVCLIPSGQYLNVICGIKMLVSTLIENLNEIFYHLFVINNHIILK